ncbi:hypothetical protein [Chryseobacterium indologenes]|uniref:Uncharacterized protein n=1 Tax=Chryseobacterium indologenes TaxID=253 RepID=A0A0N1KSM2_CHRID|nr:hypothetical protein [Chryseobacterium indologenes]KPE51000.1 hypothetical protein AOB46_12485 [Chryseobacterium indologenes]
MKSLSTKILEQIPIEHIYRFLEQKNASKKQDGGSKVGLSTASRKAKNDALTAMVRDLAK